MIKKILILTSGKKSKLRPFLFSKRELKIEVTTASFNDAYFDSTSSDLLINNGTSLANFKVIYFRLVGKSLETASLVAEYAKKNRIQIVDGIYSKSQVFPITLSKAQEMKSLADAGVAIPKTFFGSIDQIVKKSPKMFGFPFVIKSTSGKRGREVYSPKDTDELKNLAVNLSTEEKQGKKFFAQEYVNCRRRVRILVVGNKAIGSISQFTKWRKRIDGDKPVEDEKKIDKFIPNREMESLALTAVNAVGIDIAGVDILVDLKSNKLFVIEVNAAPSWKLIKEYCKVNVEYEILKFVSN